MEGGLSGHPYSFCWLFTICSSPMRVRWTSIREVFGGQDLFWAFLPNWNTQEIRKRGSQVTLVIKNTPAKARVKETQVHSLGQEDPLEEEMAIHSSILVWKTAWTEEPGGLQT